MSKSYPYNPALAERFENYFEGELSEEQSNALLKDLDKESKGHFEFELLLRDVFLQHKIVAKQTNDKDISVHQLQKAKEDKARLIKLVSSTIKIIRPAAGEMTTNSALDKMELKEQVGNLDIEILQNANFILKKHWAFLFQQVFYLKSPLKKSEKDKLLEQINLLNQDCFISNKQLLFNFISTLSDKDMNYYHFSNARSTYLILITFSFCQFGINHFKLFNEKRPPIEEFITVSNAENPFKLGNHIELYFKYYHVN